MLRRIIYLSTASPDVSDDDIKWLFEKARKNNARDAISGLSVYHKKTFIQVLEGPSDKLSACFERIQQNPMHHSVTVVNDTQVEERVFEEWSMAYRTLEDGETILHRQFTDLRDLNTSGMLDNAKKDVVVKSFLETFACEALQAKDYVAGDLQTL